MNGIPKNTPITVLTKQKAIEITAKLKHSSVASPSSYPSVMNWNRFRVSPAQNETLLAVCFLYQSKETAVTVKGYQEIRCFSITQPSCVVCDHFYRWALGASFYSLWETKIICELIRCRRGYRSSFSREGGYPPNILTTQTE